MPWKRHVLVVANVTSTSDELLDALKQRAERGTVAFTLIVPAAPLGAGRIAALQQVNEALTLLREMGLEVDGSVGYTDPMVAVIEAWDPKQYDEIILATLPTGVSKWLRADLPHRIEQRTGAPVTHIIAIPPKPGPKLATRAAKNRAVMTPL